LIKKNETHKLQPVQ